MKPIPFILIIPLSALLICQTRASTNTTIPPRAAIIQTNTGTRATTRRPAVRTNYNARYAPVARANPADHLENRREALLQQINALRRKSSEDARYHEVQTRATAGGAAKSNLRKAEDRRIANVNAQISELNRQRAALELQILQYRKIYGARTNTASHPARLSPAKRQQQGRN